MSKKTRKNSKKYTTNAKKGTQLKCILKTCRAKKYQSVYGSTTGGRTRSNRPLFY
jgi:hypothetical protein